MLINIIYQTYIAVINFCVPNNMILKYIKEKLTELWGKKDKFTITVVDFHTPL